LANHLKADLGIPASVVVIQTGHKASDGFVFLVGLVVDVNANYHAFLDGNWQAP